MCCESPRHAIIICTLHGTAKLHANHQTTQESLPASNLGQARTAAGPGSADERRTRLKASCGAHGQTQKRKLYLFGRAGCSSAWEGAAEHVHMLANTHHHGEAVAAHLQMYQNPLYRHKSVCAACQPAVNTTRGTCLAMHRGKGAQEYK